MLALYAAALCLLVTAVMVAGVLVATWRDDHKN